MKKVLFITRHYLSDNNGGANATKGFVHAFAKVFADLTLIYAEHDDEDNSYYVPESVVCLPCFDHRSKIRKGLDVYRGKLHRLPDYVKNHLACNKYDIIVLDHSVTAASLIITIKKTGASIITIHHNVEKDYIRDNEPSWLYRLPSDYFSIKAERDALLMSDINLTLTQNDAEVFSTWYKELNLHLHTVGICEYRPLPEKVFEKKTRTNTFIITGSLCFKQSYEPIVEFIEHYYHLLIDRCPDSRLIIAGRNPGSKIVEACKDKERIQLIANPDDMGKLLESADYYICPVNAGSGIKLRMTDGLKYGLPILCHDISAIGYESFVDQSMVFIYNDESSFVNALDKMLGKENDSQIVYDTFRKEFSVETFARKLNHILIEEFGI